MKFRLTVVLILSSFLIMSCEGGHHSSTEHDHHHESEKEEHAIGPHGGKLFEKDGFALEVTIYEPDIPPQSRVYTYLNGKPLDPTEVTLVTELHRIDRVDTINYKKQDDYLQGDKIVEEPHSFDVKLNAKYKGINYFWQYSSYEGRTILSNDAIESAGIKIEKAASGKIASALKLNARVVPNRLKVANVSARFPGLVKSINKYPGSSVQKGELLASIESNESLKVYDLVAPLAGEIISADAAIGENVEGEKPLFVVGDLSTVWLEISVPRSKFSKLKVGQKVVVKTETDGEEQYLEGNITQLTQLADPDSQTLLARAELSNTNQALVPGLLVETKIILEEREVPLVVRKEAVQTFRDWNVVFLKVGQIFEIAILELGQEDGDWVEVKSGILPGSEYVTENSFVVKADVMKSGATHDH